MTGRSSIPEKPVIESRSRGVRDAPVGPVTGPPGRQDPVAGHGRPPEAGAAARKRFKRSGDRVASRKTRQIENPEPRFDSIETEKALTSPFTGGRFPDVSRREAVKSSEAAVEGGQMAKSDLEGNGSPRGGDTAVRAISGEPA